MSDGDPNMTQVTFSCVEGGWPGEGNIDCDPQLTADLHLSLGSCCIDSGDTLAVPADLYVDMSGRGRRMDDACTSDTGIAAGVIPVTVDMGAYEYHFVGDLTGDDVVDLADLATLLSAYGVSCP